MSTPSRPNPQDHGRKAQEWGERIETGRNVARGGKTSGQVLGATSEMGPSEWPDDSLPVDEQKRRAVTAAIEQIGENADPSKLGEICHAQAGIDMSAGEIAAIVLTLRDQPKSTSPDRPARDRPAPENHRRPTR